jgi:tRNA(fMet)-specific endonuclease VapC
MLNVLYDTNILIKIVRDKSTTERVRKIVNPHNGLEYTSLINKAEILSIAMQNNWGTTRRNRLEKLFDEIVVVDISDESILNGYINIDAFSQGKYLTLKLKGSAKNMGKNDIWIAATASVFQFVLITTDKDFDHLDGVFLNRILFDPDKL